ncbi:hypothetical protein F3Y22_tig00111336pilonHSYRG00028 [Hibiscus syriacus]|uniref:Uncharacterized protein n=1 Tax=Hibiscus syriacus TaxID=106335 RepID=A0A6A2YPI0_HIBSY|nr:hypothetical protein F3Y22_tig00111336pilonHSYRG00028 [Hibiscus syriacus]
MCIPSPIVEQFVEAVKETVLANKRWVPPVESQNPFVVVLKFGGVSSKKPGISEVFHGLDATIGGAPRDGTKFLEAVGVGFVTEEDALAGEAEMLVLDGVDGRRVGVVALDEGLDEGIGLAVGVEDLTVDLVGVEDLAETVSLVAGDRLLTAETVGFVDEVKGFVTSFAADVTGLDAEIDGDCNVARDVGVDDLAGLDAVNVGRRVGVAGLEPGPPDDEGLRVPVELNPGDKAG